jgi:hypothetical protein
MPLVCVKLTPGSIGCHHNKMGICQITSGGLQIKLGNYPNKIGKLFKYIGILLSSKVMTWKIKGQPDFITDGQEVRVLNDSL